MNDLIFPEEIKDIDEKSGTLYVWDPDFLLTEESKYFKSKGWKIQLRIPEE